MTEHHDFPDHYPAHQEYHRDIHVSGTSANIRLFCSGNVPLFFPASHSVKTSHSCARYDGQALIYVCEAQNKHHFHLHTALHWLLLRPGHTFWPRFQVPEHGKAIIPYAVQGQRVHRHCSGQVILATVLQ